MIYLTRHGQTEFNAIGRWQGQVDSPLTALGVQQAQRMGRTLHALIEPAEVTIFSSPLGRARHTATIIAEMLGTTSEIVLDPRLKEVGMGSWDGLTEPEIDAGWPNTRKALERHEWFFHSPDGESYESMTERLAFALKDIAAHKAPARVIVSHGVAGRILRGLFAGLDRDVTLRLDVPQDAISEGCHD